MKKSLFSPTFLRTLCVSSLLAILSACGSGSSSSPQPVTPPPVTVVPAAKHTATAFFSLAPVDAGICRMYRLTDVANVADLSTVTALATAISVTGSVSFPDLDYTGAALIECTGGTYDDEATPVVDTTNAPSGLRSVVEVTTNGAYVVTLVTHAAAYLARDNLSAALGDNGTNETVADLFGLDGMDITTEKPIDLNTTNATNTGGRYMLNYATDYRQILADLMVNFMPCSVANAEAAFPGFTYGAPLGFV